MTDFTKKLLHWNAKFNQRQMPWKGEKDPYKIWLSEIILQQTRVEQGWNYYEKFIEKFPTICDLANASDAVIFKLWEGLGYYNRCKNLLFTARFICEKLNGKFPDNYEETLSLKGVGSYTASAICSFAYNQPHAVVDGNVFRVLSRVYGIKIPIDSNEGKEYFTQVANENLPKKFSAKHNQAIMDFGATVCTPATPACNNCVMNKICIAYKTGTVNGLPVKEKMLKKRTRFLSWFVIKVKDEMYIHQREQNDIWQNLYEFFVVETKKNILWNEKNAEDFLFDQFSLKPLVINVSDKYNQALTHQNIKAIFIEVEFKNKPQSLAEKTWIKRKQLSKFAFPKIINDYLICVRT